MEADRKSYHRWKQRTVLLMSLSLGILAGCDVTSPDSFEFQLTSLPLMNETVHLGEKIAGGDSIAVLNDGDSSLAIDITKTGISLSQSDFGQDRLTVDAQPTQTIRQQLGSELSVEPSGEKATAPVSLAELFPDLQTAYDTWKLLNPGQTDWVTDLAAAPIPPTFRAFEVYPNLQSLTFNSDSIGVNRVLIGVVNNTPILLEITTDLANDTTDITGGRHNNPIASTTIPAPPNSVSDKSDLSLANKTINNPMMAIIGGQVPAQTGVTINQTVLDGGFHITSDILALGVASATAVFPGQSIKQISRVPVASGPGLQLESIEFTTTSDPNLNAMVIGFTNRIGADVELTFDMPDYSLPTPPSMTVNGVAVFLGDPGYVTTLLPGVLPGGVDDYAKSVFRINAGGSATVSFSLSGATLASRDTLRNLTGLPLDSTQIITTTKIIATNSIESSTPDSFVTISAADFVEVSVDLRAMELQTVRGFIPASDAIIRDMGVTSATTKFDEVDGLDGLKVREITFEAQITSTTNIAPKIDLRLEAIKDGVTAAVFTKRISIAAGSAIGTSTLIVIRETLPANGIEDPNGLLALLNSIPDEILVSGSVVIDSTVEIRRGSSEILFDYYHLTAPLYFTLPAITIDIHDGGESGFDITMDKDARNDILPKIVEMEIDITITNFTPIGGRMAIFLSTDSTFSALTQVYPVESRDNVDIIPNRIPADADPSFPGSGPGAGVFKLTTIGMVAAATDPLTGFADRTKPGASVDTIAITSLLRFLENPEVYLLPRIQISATDAARLTIHDDFNIAMWLSRVRGETDPEGW